MRNAKLIVLAILAVVSMAACKKEYCWQCETAITTLVISAAHDTTRIYDTKYDLLCNRTEKEINRAERDATTETVTQDANQSIYRKFKMSCKK